MWQDRHLFEFVLQSQGGREERTSQLCIKKNWMFKAQPAIRSDGFAASGTEMSSQHIQRGTFCAFYYTSIRYGMIDICKALVRIRDSASPQTTKRPQISMDAPVCIHKYTQICMHAHMQV